MFGIILIYFIGNAFYKLAWRHEKPKWNYTIFGIVTYYAGIFFGSTLLAVIAIFLGHEITEAEEPALGFLALPFGILSCWSLYKWLDRRWSNVSENYSHPDILDEDFTHN